MTDFDCFCLLINHEKKPIGKRFSVKLSPEDRIWALKEKVKQERENDLIGIDAPNISVWKCPELYIAGDTAGNELTPDEITRRINETDFNDNRVAACPRVDRRVAELRLSEDDTLLVQIPCACSYSSTMNLSLKDISLWPPTKPSSDMLTQMFPSCKNEQNILRVSLF
jgi:hypothetical protein